MHPSHPEVSSHYPSADLLEQARASTADLLAGSHKCKRSHSPHAHIGPAISTRGMTYAPSQPVGVDHSQAAQLASPDRVIRNRPGAPLTPGGRSPSSL